MRAPCRCCRRDSAVTRRGLVWAHRALPRPERCPGAGLPPLGAPHTGPEPAPAAGQLVHPPPWVSGYDGAGTVYLLCFDAPFGHARHYLGWASPGNLDRRLAYHGGPSGANLMWHVAKAGIGWELSRTWAGSRTEERRLKVRGGHTRKCPRCRPAIAARLAASRVDADR